jgi:hypothetical protein
MSLFGREFGMSDEVYNNIQRSYKSVNVVKFGADPDGIKDSSQAFQNAINYIGQKFGSGILVIPEGRYIISQTINMNSITTNSSNGNAGIIIEGSGSNTTELVYTGNSIFFDGFGSSSSRKFVRFRGFRVMTAVGYTAYAPNTIAFNLTYNQRYCHFDEVDIMAFDYGVKMTDNWIMEFRRVNTDKCNYGLYFTKDCNAINIYGGEHKGANTAGIYLGDGEAVNIYGTTFETSDTVVGEGHGILIDSIKYFTAIGVYSEHLKGHVLYKRGTDPVNNLFRSITLIGGMWFNFNPPVSDIKIEKTAGAAGNLVMINANFNRVDLGSDGGGFANWAFDFGCTTTDTFKNLYVADKPQSYIRPYETSFSNPLFDRFTTRQNNGYDIATFAMNAPLTKNDGTGAVTVFNQRFQKFRREDAKNKMPSYLSWNTTGITGVTVSTNARKMTITGSGVDKNAFTNNHIENLLPSTTYTLSGLATGSATGVVFRLSMYDAGKNLITNQDFTGTTITFTTPSNLDYATASFIVPATVASGTFSFENMQLELGATATAYTPYHVDAASVIVTPEGDEYRIQVGGDNQNDWKPDGSGGDKLFYISSSSGAVGAVYNLLSPRFRLTPIPSTDVTQTNVLFVDSSDSNKLKFRDQTGVIRVVNLT